MKNLTDAFIKARESANGHDYYDSVCLTVTSNKEFIIGKRCSSNVSFSLSAVDGADSPHLIHITVPKDSTFDSLVNFDVLDFCVHFNIPISNKKYTDIFGNER